ncbi:MAG: divergent polysaccharide deacetylase family protein, partial [Alphaproteobacteria bacterium]|nr:divergent polysaccharide deacetylase family protein [Alphaproteobacteria bacterium]
AATASEEASADAATEAQTPTPDAAIGGTSSGGDAFANLLPHPDPALIEQTDEGPLPKIAADGRKPWTVYSRPYNTFERRPKIAIVMTDMGISASQSQDAMELPGQISFAFAPFTRGLPDWIQRSRDLGHEVLLTLPMEPLDFPRSDPGPNALYTNVEAPENIKKLKYILSRATGYIGLISYQGSKFLSSELHANLLATRLKERGLFYMDSAYSPVNLAPNILKKKEIPYVELDLTIDRIPGRPEVSRALSELEEIANARGVAVGVARPYAATIRKLKSWAKELEEREIALVPVSSVYAQGLQNNAGANTN